MEQNTLWVDKKATFTYKISRQKGSVAACIAVVLLACIFSVCLSRYASDFVFSVAHVIIFFVAGSVQLYIVEKGLAALTATEKWICTLTLAATILLLYGSSFLWGFHMPFGVVLTSLSAFLFPFLLFNLYELYLQLSFAGAKLWYPVDETTKKYPAIYPNGTLVRFRVVQGERRETNFSVQSRVSARMSLGEIFCDLAQKQQKQSATEVPLISDEGEPFRWVFSARDMLLWKRPLDPAQTLQQNRITENAVIYAYRVIEDKHRFPVEEQD